MNCLKSLYLLSIIIQGGGQRSQYQYVIFESCCFADGILFEEYYLLHSSVAGGGGRGRGEGGGRGDDVSFLH